MDDGSASDDDENERMLEQLAAQGKVTEDQRDELLVRLSLRMQYNNIYL